VIVADPKNEPLPSKGFNAVWGKNLKKGMLDIPLAEPSNTQLMKLRMENCELIIK